MGVALPLARDAYPAPSLTPEAEATLQANPVVAVGVSGGKDSALAAIETFAYLDRIGHTGPRLLVFSDLGRIDWPTSRATCERLADHCGVELLVVHPTSGGGDLVDRWHHRWANNVARYASLSVVRLIMPWSGPGRMRFCTSEFKQAPISRALAARFPGRTIVSVTGIRREESDNRALATIWEPDEKLRSVRHRTHGFAWRPVLEWKEAQVFARLADVGVLPSETYTRYGISRHSCSPCVLSATCDLKAAGRVPARAAVYRELIALEARSTFSFQQRQWLADLAPHLLDDALRAAVERAKAAAKIRQAAEARIPKHLWFDRRGWPTATPTEAEAALLADVRRAVATAVGIEIGYTRPSEVLARYTELLEGVHRRREAECIAPVPFTPARTGQLVLWAA